MFSTAIVTCEHGGNKIPPAHWYLFQGREELLQTHVGWDPGALEAARYVSGQLNLPLFYTETCRLLVEANRSIGFKDHFSEFTDPLPDSEKQAIIEQYYIPYREEVEAFLEHLIYSDKNILHISMHSCTPVLHGEVREMDISFLFDPERASEHEFCKKMKAALMEISPEMIVKFNYPYLGTDDGFTTHLRKLFPDEKYAGIEIEINQKYPLGNDTNAWKKLQNDLCKALSSVINDQ